MTFLVQFKSPILQKYALAPGNVYLNSKFGEIPASLDLDHCTKQFFQPKNARQRANDDNLTT